MPKISANGIEFYYERHGKGNPIILICGLINTAKIWDEIVLTLKNHFEVIIFDNRGAGRSGVSSPPYTIDLLADDVVALMDALDIPKAHMLGSSMGTAIVQSLGLRHKNRLLKGILLAPFNTIPSTAVMAIKTMTKLFDSGLDPSLAFETILPWLFSNTFLSEAKKVEQMISDKMNNPFPQSSDGYAGQLAALIAFDLTDKLPEIKTEMLLIAGKEDLFTPFHCAKILEENLPNARLLSIPEVGHKIYIEAVETVVEETIAFCNTQ